MRPDLGGKKKLSTLLGGGGLFQQTIANRGVCLVGVECKQSKSVTGNFTSAFQGFGSHDFRRAGVRIVKPNAHSFSVLQDRVPPGIANFDALLNNRRSLSPGAKNELIVVKDE